MSKLEEFQEYLRTTPKKGGMPFSETYINWLSYYVKRLEKFSDAPVNIGQVNKFITANDFQPTAVRALATYLKFLGFPKEEIAKLYIPPKKPKKKSLKERILSFDEIDKLFSEAPTLEDRLILEMLYFTASRRGDANKGLLGITVERTDLSKKMTTVEIKGGELFELYWEDQQTNDDLREYLNENKITSGRIFRFSPYSLWYRVKKLCKTILEKEVTPHDFRRTAMTHMGMRKANPLWIQKKAGHKDIATTMIYVELGQEFAKEATKYLSRDKKTENI